MLPFMDKYEMLDHIKAHSIVVARVARMIAMGFRKVNPDISVSKTTAGALLHDIGKTPSLSSGGNHAKIGEQICIENGFTEIAPIVAEHVILKNYHLSDADSEKEVVFYADKRVNHDKIVTLKEREAYILERYGRGQEELCRRIQSNFRLCGQVEEKLFRKLGFSPESLLEMDGAETERFEKGPGDSRHSLILGFLLFFLLFFLLTFAFSSCFFLLLFLLLFRFLGFGCFSALALAISSTFFSFSSMTASRSRVSLILARIFLTSVSLAIFSDEMPFSASRASCWFNCSSQ
jgi:uncharacterized protein